MFFSDGSIHCGNLVRDNAGIYGGKGGGSNVQARAIFPDNKNIETFADLIDKHLR
jgi:alanyl-tRNA synthetase